MNKRRISLIVFIIGIITLIAGAIFLIVRIVTTPNIADSEYLVSIGKWKEEDASSVVWDFIELGKGTLTTNNHINDYDFRWAIEEGKIRIETDWLYTLNDEFEYSLDQNSKTLIIVKDGENIKFTPAESDTN